MATSYYSTGTISLTNGSAVVIGVGTAWVVNLITNGYVLVEASAGQPLPILSVDNDTQITAEFEWQGATGSYSYAIMRNPDQLQDNAENSRNLTHLLGELRKGTLFKYDASGSMADRSLFDGRPKNFSYLVTEGEAASLYVKASNASGDWVGPFSYGKGDKGDPGPGGPYTAISFTAPDTLPPGSAATVTQTPDGPGAIKVTLGLPAGENGTGTGSVTSVDLSVPAGLTVVGGPVTTSGVFTVSYAEGYQGFTTAHANTIGGLGNSSSRNVGTTAGTVAAGDDARLSNNAKLNVEDQTLIGGARVTSKDLGPISTGTLTLDPGDRPLQHYTNNGAHTLAPGLNTGSFLLDVTNGASAGAITLTGWTKVAGDAFTTTSGQKFRLHCSIGVGGSLVIVQGMQ